MNIREQKEWDEEHRRYLNSIETPRDRMWQKVGFWVFLGIVIGLPVIMHGIVPAIRWIVGQTQ